MIADLERLIRLQQLDTFSETARRRVADHPNLVQALDARLASSTEGVDLARKAMEENRAARRAVEKDLAMIQARLSKFKDQLMEVKTNREYQAMLKEIEVAQNEVRQLEDRILERMLEADDLAVMVKEAEARLAGEKAAVAAERVQLEDETQRLQVELEEAAANRADILAQISPPVLATYETVARGRRGLAVVEARDGFCSACHVRLRPQVYNELHRNDAIHQCGSCQRILYYVPRAVDTQEATPGEAQ